MYFIINPRIVIAKKYYKEDETRLLVPTEVPHLFATYDDAHNAIARTETMCKKLKKLKLFSGLDTYNNPAVPTKHSTAYKNALKRDPERVRLHERAMKSGFYGFSSTEVKVVRVVMPKKASKPKISPRQMGAIVKLEVLNAAVHSNKSFADTHSDTVNRLTSYASNLTPQNIKTINYMYDTYAKYYVPKPIGDFNLDSRATDASKDMPGPDPLNGTASEYTAKSLIQRLMGWMKHR